jgi:hypothetical protein
MASPNRVPQADLWLLIGSTWITSSLPTIWKLARYA